MDSYVSELRTIRREVRLLRLVSVVGILLWVLASPFSANSAQETDPVGTSLKLPVRILNENGRTVLQVRQMNDQVVLEQFDPAGIPRISFSSSRYGGNIVVGGAEQGAVTISSSPTAGGVVALFNGHSDRPVLRLSVQEQMGQIYIGRLNGYLPYALLGATVREGGFLHLGGHQWDAVSIDGRSGKYKMRINHRPPRKPK